MSRRICNITTGPKCILPFQTRARSSVPTPRTTVFSGIQPTGVPHLGNYLGAIRTWVDLQLTSTNPDTNLVYSIVDLHSLTTLPNPNILRQNIFHTACALLACGLNPGRCLLYQQSRVPHHCELLWILGCLLSINRLNSVPTWRERTGTPLYGAYSYPLLMTADVLLYKATVVPVGEDQLPHMTLVSDIIQLFNNRYGKMSFPKPQLQLTRTPRIRSLRNPASKMSKSDEDERSRISLTDTEDVIIRKIKQSVTDSIRDPEIAHDMGKRPGVSNLINIYSACAGLGIEATLREFEGGNKTRLKAAVGEVVVETLKPIRCEFERLVSEKGFVERVLDEGAEKANDIARVTLAEVMEKIGIK